MKKCLNCHNMVKEEDNFCRHCGIKIQGNNHYILINVLKVFVIIGWILLILLFVASFIVYK